MFSIKLFRAEMYLWYKAITLTKNEEGFYFKDGMIEHLQGSGKVISSGPNDYRQGIFTHFHPLPQPIARFGISYLDVNRMLFCQDKQIRAVYPHGVYRILNPYWDKPFIPYMDWEVMMQSEGHAFYTPISPEDTWITELDLEPPTTYAWHSHIGVTRQAEFKPRLKDILGATLDIVPFGVI